MERKVYRGDVFYANLDGAIGSEQRGRRPVVIVQNNIGNKLANTVIVVPLTKKRDKTVKLPTHILVKAFENIKQDSTILTEQIRVLDKSRLGDKIGRLPDNLIKLMNKSIKIALEINELSNIRENRVSLIKKLTLFFVFGGKNMKLDKILKNIEYTTKEAIAYYLVAFKKVKNSEKQTLSDYIREIIYTIEKIDKKEILGEIDTTLIAEFPFAYKLNNEELMSYGLVTFYMLLKSNKIITSKDIVSQVETEMRLFSTRTIIDEADKLLDKLQK